MHLQTYYCQSMGEAITRVRAELGDGAAVLHARTVRRGLLRKRVLEVVATDTPPDELPTDAVTRNADGGTRSAE
ncbi:MAG: hypothetical protein AAFV43_12825 [Planctomycetota bacterium]